MTASRPRRRVVLAGAGALVLSGCLPGQAERRPTAADRERRVRLRIAEEVDELAAAFDAVVDRHPGTSGLLGTLAAETRTHAAALRGPRPTASDPASTATATATPTPTPSASPVAADRASAVAALADVVARAGRRRAGQAAPARPELARLLASISACEAGHAALLRGGQR